MQIALRELASLDRKRFQRLVKLIAAFEDSKITTITKQIAQDLQERQVVNLARDPLSRSFKEAIAARYGALPPFARAAVAKAVFPDIASSPADHPSSPRNVPGLSDLRHVLRQFDFSHFGIDTYSDLPGRPTAHYLIVRLHESERQIRVSRMAIRFHGEGRRIPTFTTHRQTEFGKKKTVTGILLRSHQEIYTIGQLHDNDGLRISRLKMMSGHDETGTRFVDLYGLRLGRNASNERSFAHVVFAKQIKPETAGESAQFLDNRAGSIFDSDDAGIRAFIPELPEILPKLAGTPTIGGIQPCYWD